MPTDRDHDPLADKLFTAISDAVMLAAAGTAGFDPTKLEHQRSLLRAVGATMALFAHGAFGLTVKDAAALVLVHFEDKLALARGRVLS